MGLFDKKYCDICSQKIGLLGNRKLEDGNLCKDCAKKLSPWFDERRHSTVEQIRAQLAYREENRKALFEFSVTRTFGRGTTLAIDEGKCQFMVCQTDNFEEENPDVIDISKVTSCDVDVQESRTEDKQEVRDSDGKTMRVSYNPPRYDYRYDFYIVIRVNHPYFDEIKFKLNKDTIWVRARDTYANNMCAPPSSGFDLGGKILNSLSSALNQNGGGGGMQYGQQAPSMEYKHFYDMAMELKQTLMSLRA